MTQQAGWFPLSSCQDTPDWYISNCIAEITVLLQYCQGKKREEKQRNASSACVGSGRKKRRSERKKQKREEAVDHRKERTSEREYAVDA